MYCDREIEPTVTKKVNSFTSLKLGDEQFSDKMKLLEGALTLDSFLKAYNAGEINKFFPDEWYDSPYERDCTELPPYEAFFT